MAGTTVRPAKPRESRLHRWLLRLEYAYLMRFPLLAALVLAVGLPAGFLYAPSMFVGLFDAGGFWAFTFVLFMEFELAWSIMVTTRLILVYGPSRFPSLRSLGAREPGALRWRQAAGFGLLALPALAATWAGSEGIQTGTKLAGTVFGLAGSLLVLLAASFVHFRIEHGGGRTAQMVLPTFAFARPRLAADHDWERQRLWAWKWMDRVFGRLPHELTDGLMRDGDGEGGTKKRFFRSGHEMAVVVFFLLIAIYLLGFFYSPRLVRWGRQPTALFYLLFLLMLFTWFYYLAAFILDRFRLPVLSAMLLLSLLTGLIRTDHVFKVVPSPREGELPAAEVIRLWEAGPRNGATRPLTVVAAAGGGIQAAAWTARVVTGLQAACGETFSSSLLLVSAVSGGSVGAMHALAPYDAAGRYPSGSESLREVLENATRSSLSAAGWGLLYPDTLRTLPFIGALINQDWDRGWALETAWAAGWSHPPNLSDWRHDVGRGVRPAVILNATAAESGERFLFGTTELSTPGGMQFGRDYNGWDLPIATAARLSASFPYVSPMARASAAGDEKKRVHVADGGYYDNSGMVSALTWLTDAESALKGRTVILIAIDSGSSAPADGQAWSWQGQMVAPVATLVRLRDASQSYRGALESRLVRSSLERSGVRVISAPFTFNGDMPLSWHLNPTQKRNVENAWAFPSEDIARAKSDVFAALGCQAANEVAARR